MRTPLDRFDSTPGQFEASAQSKSEFAAKVRFYTMLWDAIPGLGSSAQPESCALEKAGLRALQPRSREAMQAEQVRIENQAVLFEDIQSRIMPEQASAASSLRHELATIALLLGPPLLVEEQIHARARMALQPKIKESYRVWRFYSLVNRVLRAHVFLAFLDQYFTDQASLFPDDLLVVPHKSMAPVEAKLKSLDRYQQAKGAYLDCHNCYRESGNLLTFMNGLLASLSKEVHFKNHLEEVVKAYGAAWGASDKTEPMQHPLDCPLAMDRLDEQPRIALKKALLTLWEEVPPESLEQSQWSAFGAVVHDAAGEDSVARHHHLLLEKWLKESWSGTLGHLLEKVDGEVKAQESVLKELQAEDKGFRQSQVLLVQDFKAKVLQWCTDHPAEEQRLKLSQRASKQEKGIEDLIIESQIGTQAPSDMFSQNFLQHAMASYRDASTDADRATWLWLIDLLLKHGDVPCFDFEAPRSEATERKENRSTDAQEYQDFFGALEEQHRWPFIVSALTYFAAQTPLEESLRSGLHRYATRTDAQLNTALGYFNRETKQRQRWQSVVALVKCLYTHDEDQLCRVIAQELSQWRDEDHSVRVRFLQLISRGSMVGSQLYGMMMALDRAHDIVRNTPLLTDSDVTAGRLLLTNDGTERTFELEASGVASQRPSGGVYPLLCSMWDRFAGGGSSSQTGSENTLHEPLVTRSDNTSPYQGL